MFISMDLNSSFPQQNLCLCPMLSLEGLPAIMRHDTFHQIFRVQDKCWFLLGVFSLGLPGGLRKNSEAESFMIAEVER